MLSARANSRGSVVSFRYTGFGMVLPLNETLAMVTSSTLTKFWASKPQNSEELSSTPDRDTPFQIVLINRTELKLTS